jgi:transaldolase
MKFFLDTADTGEISWAMEYGVCDGVTTNPTLLAAQGGDWQARAKVICAMVPGPVSLEVVATEAESMVQEALELVKIGPNVVVKLPMTWEGVKAMRQLSLQEIETNATLVFSPAQALLAAKAGASFASPFVGRLDTLSQPGMELVARILDIYAAHGFETQVLVASVRHPGHVIEAAQLGAHVVTLPPRILRQLVEHPLTDSGLAAFLEDWRAAFGKG